MSVGSLHAAAVEYAQAGFSVFPVVPRGKKPLRKGWQRRATDDLGIVEALWRELPEANIGVLTGRGLIVVDADTPEAVSALRSLGLPDTTTVTTARGKHYYLTGNGSNRASVLPGVDVRGKGGYVVGAGSLHPSGVEYRWDIPPWEVGPAPAPPELMAHLTRKRPSSVSPAAAGPIERGSRNTALFKLACSLRGLAGLADPELYAALTAANKRRCRPPLDNREVEAIARSAAKYEAAPLWLTDPIGFAADPMLGARERYLLAALARYANHEGACWPGVRRLRADTGMATDTIKRATNALVKCGRINVETRRGKSSLYRLLEQPERSLPSTKGTKTGSSVLDGRTPGVTA